MRNGFFTGKANGQGFVNGLKASFTHGKHTLILKFFGYQDRPLASLRRIAEPKSHPYFSNTGLKDKQMSPTEPKAPVREFLASLRPSDSMPVEKIHEKLEPYFVETNINAANLETVTIKQGKGLIVSIASTNTLFPYTTLFRYRKSVV